MAFSENTVQARELTELRNHLRWLDEERRKSTRRLGELEQRFAQQGREVSERDRRIQELEWQLGNLTERLDQLPQDNSAATAHEQRIQNLELHLSNINAQLLRFPKIEEELGLLRDEFTTLTGEQRERQSRVESDLEQRLAAEQENLNDHLRQLEDRLQIQDHLKAELDIQRNANMELTRQVSELREQIPDAVTRLERDLLIRVDEEAQASANALASVTGSLTQVEQQLSFRQAADNQTEEQLEDIRSSLSRVLFIEQDLTQISARVDEQMTQLALQLEEESNQIIQRLTADLDERLKSVSTRIEEIQHNIPPDVREAIVNLEQEIELRRVAEDRLSNSISIQEGKLTPLTVQIADLRETLLMVKERTGRDGDVSEQLKVLGPQVNELGERMKKAAERLGILGHSAVRLEDSVKSLSEGQSELRASVVTLNEQINDSEKEVERQLEVWRITLDEQKDIIDRFAQQWTVLSNQYKEARMAGQNFAHWQKQLEQQWREEVASIDELLIKLQQDNRNLIWRVQTAQADAIKKWPRLWLEEIEKAVELNPDRPLQSSSAAPLHTDTDMSVIDALEQGLIKIDYEEDLDQSLEQS